MTTAPRTSTLLRKICASKDMKGLLARHRSDFALPPFHVYLNRLCDARGLVPEQVILRAAIHRTYGHQLFNGIRKPSRDKALQLALGLALGVEEAQTLLKMARAAALYPRIERDAAILYALNKRLSVLETQSLLGELGLTLLGGADKDA